MEKEIIGKIKQTTICEKIVAKILDLVEQGVYQPGELLPTERDFSEMFGVGRSTVREALRVLQSMEIVEKRAGSGSYLTDIPVGAARIFNTSQMIEAFNVLDMSEARQALEVQTVALAARRASGDQIEAMAEANARLEEAVERGDKEEIVECDFRVHKAIAEGSQNVFMCSMLDALAVVLLKSNIEVMSEDKTKAALEYHRRIIDRIQAGDEEGAREAMAGHIRDVKERVTKGIKNK